MKFALSLFSFMMTALLSCAPVSAGEVKPLPAPQKEGGMPLMEALNKRQSGRTFADKQLSEQELSNLLWAGFGVNRPDGRRTAPSAVNWQEIDIYVATAQGLFKYLPKEHALEHLKTEDVRGNLGMQAFAKKAPLGLIYVAEYGRIASGKPLSEVDRATVVSADTGFISENVYLYCASASLNTVVLGMVDRDALGKSIGLDPAKAGVVFTQVVGYPASAK